MSQVKKFVRILIPRRVRNWLRSPGKSVEWAWDEFKYKIGFNPVIEMRPGWSLRCHPGAYGFAYWAQDADPEQVAEFNGFISSCRSEMVLFDIGAHFGLFSLAALHYGGASAKAIAVDPSATATRMMGIQAHLNEVSQRLSIVQAAVGESTDWHEMVTVGVMSGGYLVAAGKDHPPSEITRAPATTLDKLVENFGALPTHIKVDVEGFEAEVLKGGSHVLSQLKAPLLFLELHNQMIHDRGGSPEETLLILRKFKYDTFTVAGYPINDSEILSRPIIRVVAKRQQN
jgi:FkbM family methyltransferase